MKVVVIGSGVIGVSTAYFLGKAGHDVPVLDRQTGPGLETSFANGSLLTPGMPEPWNAPGCWRELLASLGRSDAALQLRLKAIPGMLGWGARFLRNSSPAAYKRNSLNNLRLALFSLKTLQALREETGIDYAAGTSGTVKIFRDKAALDAASAATEPMVAEGLAFRRLSRSETVELEPALSPIEAQLAGSIHYPGDETGDAHGFCLALCEKAREQGVVFSFGMSVSSIETRLGQVSGVRTARQVLVADHYVLAAGSFSATLLRPLGIRLPVRPAKGYSVTFPSTGSTSRPAGARGLKIPIVDEEMHTAIVPVGDRIRIAGTAEFAGFDLSMRMERVQNLLNLATSVLPNAGLDRAKGTPWCGLRPMSADGVPIIGHTSIPNLSVSTGHGHLGWTMAAGSGKLLAQLLSAQAPSLDPRPYLANRFNAYRDVE